MAVIRENALPSEEMKLSNGIRLAGICCSIVGFAVAFILAPDMPQAWGPFIAIFAGLLGVPLAVRAVQKKLGIEPQFGLDTWNEWHAMASGWGDGAALNKAEKIPDVKDLPEKTTDDDFHAIIAREAWWYKVGVALGRLTWPFVIFLIAYGLIMLLG